MNFQELLQLEGPRSFKEGTIYWEFTLYGINKPRGLVRTGDTGHYTSDDENCNGIFRFNNFDKFREAYIAAHEENIRRLKEKKGPLLEIGKMRSDDWTSHVKDNCG